MWHQKVKQGVWIIEDLGSLFFHNGDGCLKLNKAWYMSSLSNQDIAVEILRKFPDFFEPATGTEGTDDYENSKIRLTTGPHPGLQ